MTDAAGTDGNPVLLILEDEPMILMDLALAGEDEGLEVLQATSAEKALSILGKEKVDVAILDVNLGRDQSCADVAGRLDELGIPFVIHSGDLDRQGEIIRSLKAPLYPKPTAATTVVKGAIDLVSESAAS